MLLQAGYDRVQWVNTEQFGNVPCPLCQQIANEVNGVEGGLSLAAFLGREEVVLTRDDGEGNQIPVPPEEDTRSVDEKYPKVIEIYRNAPIYNWAHVGCKCGVRVYKSSEEGDGELVFRNGGPLPDIQ